MFRSLREVAFPAAPRQASASNAANVTGQGESTGSAGLFVVAQQTGGHPRLTVRARQGLAVERGDQARAASSERSISARH